MYLNWDELFFYILNVSGVCFCLRGWMYRCCTIPVSENAVSQDRFQAGVSVNRLGLEQGSEPGKVVIDRCWVATRPTSVPRPLGQWLSHQITLSELIPNPSNINSINGRRIKKKNIPSTFYSTLFLSVDYLYINRRGNKLGE